MRRTNQLWVALIIAAAGLLGGCGGSDTSTPKATVKTFADALNRGDAAAVKAVTINVDPKFIDIMTSLVSSNKALENAAVAKFGADGNGLAEDSKILGNIDKSLDTAEIKEEGDTATVKTKDSPEPLTLKKVDGQWKIDFAQAKHVPTKEEITQMEPMFNAMLDVNKQLVSDISAGKYKTAGEAKQAKQEKMMAAMMSGMKPPGEGPK
jgi:hypothetical protein